MSSKNQKFIFFLSALVVMGVIGFAGIVFAQPDLGISEVGKNIGLGSGDIRLLVARIIRVALGLLGIVAVGLAIYAGYMWMTAGGNSDRIEEAKKILANSVIGLVIILSAYALVSFVFNKLVDATRTYPSHCYNNKIDGDETELNCGAAGGDCRVCSRDDCPDGSCLNLYVRQMPAGGEKCIRNIKLEVVFTEAVDIDSLNSSDNAKVIVKDTGERVAGQWAVGNRTNVAVFTPVGECSAVDDGTDCFAADKEYILNKLSTDITALSGHTLACELGSGCGPVEFKTGVGIDRQAPVLRMSAPPEVEQGTVATIQVDFTDDNGMQNVSVYDDSNRYLGGQSLPGCQTSGHVYVDWNTAGVRARTYDLEGVGTDGAGQIGTSTARLAVRPPHCYNHVQDEDETGEDCGLAGGDCGICDNNNCAANEDCASGYCDLTLSPPVCAPRLRIDSVDPWSGVSGNYISIFGRYFGKNIGKVYFKKGANADGSIIWTPPANLPCGDLFPWSESQIVVQVPLLAQNGPIKVEAAASDTRPTAYKSDITSDNWGGARRDFVVAGDATPGLCPIVPNYGLPNSPVSLHGINFGSVLGTVSFGGQSARMLSGGWTNTLINTFVPSSLLPSTVGVKLTVWGKDSNSVKFKILPSLSDADSPRITGLSPTHGAPGTYLTITGKHLGMTAGKVWFKKGGTGTAIPGDFLLPENCRDTWRDDQVVVKFPARTVSGVEVGEMYSVQIETADSVLTPIDSNYFNLEDGTPGPGLCKLVPESSPLPLPVEQTMKVYGDNLGEASVNVFKCNDTVRTVCSSDSDCPDVASSATISKCTYGDYTCAQDSDCADIYDMPPLRDGRDFLRISADQGFCYRYSGGVYRYPYTYGATYRACSVNADCVAPEICSRRPIGDGSGWLPPNNKCVPHITPTTVPGKCERAATALGSSQIYFNAAGANPLTIAGRQLPVQVISAANDFTELLPPLLSSGIQTGPVVAYRTVDSKMSNALNFEVRDCTQNGNTCTIPGYQCCASGVEKGICKSAGTVCSGNTRSTGYVWRFSTKDIPPPLAVVEQCPGSMDNFMPSPSPSTIWNPIGGLQDHNNVCKNALIEVVFSRNDLNAIAKDQARIFKCTADPDEGGTCATEVSAENLAAEDVGGKYQTASALRDGFTAGAGQQFLELRNLAGNWDNDTWYQVRLGVGISAGAGTSTATLAPTRSCDANSAYCFKFKTSAIGRSCDLSRVLITPAKYWTNRLESPLRYHSLAVGPVPLYYSGHGLSNQRCIMMDMTGYNWQWSSLATDFAEIYNGGNTSNKMEVETLRNTVNVTSDNAVNIHVLAQKDAGQFENYSPLTIDLSNPQVVDNWPKCLEACLNSDIGVKFNIPMSSVNLDKTALRLYRCDTEDCLTRVDVSDEFLLSPARAHLLAGDKSIIELEKIKNLEKNTIYQVTVSNKYDHTLSRPSDAFDTVWSVGKVTQDSSFSKPYNEEYTWKFRTKSESCKIDRVEVLPEVFSTRRIDAKAVYNATPYSAPDSCDAKGQKLKPNSVGWNWQSDQLLTATVSQFRTVGRNKYCTGNCLRKGSDIAYGVSGTGVGGSFRACGNGVLEAGEDCENPSVASGCGLDCLYVGNTNRTATVNGTDQRLCGDGFITPTAGEECDPNSAITSEKINCSVNCLHTGSKTAPAASAVSASICGNGTRGVGEECDLGIAATSTGPDSGRNSALGCTASCLHQGTRLTSAWCSAHASDRGGFDVTTFHKYCDLAYSKCGDRSRSLDEDIGCDGPDVTTLPIFCDQFCLKKGLECLPNSPGCNGAGRFTGSSLLYDDPSVCGDQHTGTGEQDFCETDPVFETTAISSSLFDPWALARGVGYGPVAVGSDPPIQLANIKAETNQETAVGVTKSGSGRFEIRCGYKSDAECAAAHGGDTSFGVAANSCCYARPNLTAVYPGSIGAFSCPTGSTNPACNVCRNTYIAGSFDSQIDKNSISGNLLIARKVLVDEVAAPTIRTLGTPLSDSASEVKITNPRSLSISDNYAYVVGHDDNALEIIDISSPVNSAHKISVDGITSPTVAVAAKRGTDTYVYVGDSSGGVTFVNVSNIIATNAVNSDNTHRYVAGNGHEISSIFADASRVYAVYRDMGRMTVLDAGSGAKIIDLQYSEATNQDSVITVRDNYAYVYQGTQDDTSVSSNLFVIDLSGDSASWRKVGTFSDTNIITTPLALTWYGDKLVVASVKGLALVDVSNAADLKILASNINSSASAVAVSGKYAFVAVGDIIRVLDLSVGLLKVGQFTIGELTMLRDLKYNQGLLYTVGVGYGGVSDKFRVFDVSDWFRPELDPCAGMSDVTSLVVANSREDYSGAPWYRRVWQRLASLAEKWFGGNSVQALTQIKWCAGGDIGDADVVDEFNGAGQVATSSVVVRLRRPLSSDADYKILLTDGVKDTRGVSIGRPANATTTNWSFHTASQICEVENVSVTPSDIFFSVRGATSTLLAKAYTKPLVTGMGVQIQRRIQPIPQAYYWEYLWGPVNPFVALTSTTADTNVITAGNNNGEIDITAVANITENNYTAAKGVVSNKGNDGRAHIIVFLCENPWPPNDLVLGGSRYKIFPYEDAPDNNDGYNFASDTFDNTPILPSIISAPHTDGYYNFSTYYCADNGASGTYDDLPYLRAAVQVSSTIVSATTSLKRFIFTDKYNRTSDAIGIQIFANPDFLTVSDWLAREDISGDFQKVSIDGYDAMVDGANNNFYVEALNYTPTAVNSADGAVYSNIYLFSLSNGAGPGMRQVFKQLLSNLNFNTNLTNYGVCGPDVITPSFTTTTICATDFDCVGVTGATKCAVQADKLKRNYARLRDLKQMTRLLANYYNNSSREPSERSYPQLAEGTYLSGQTVSAWPSWGTLGNLLGQQLPRDPALLNRVAPAGTCTTNTARFCLTDSDCNSGVGSDPSDTCTLHDSVTGWSTADRRFSFACNSASLAYRYIATSSTGYQIRSQMEELGFALTNWDKIWPKFFSNLATVGLSDPKSFNDLTSPELGICLAPQEINTVRGVCGDGKLNLDQGEECEPRGSRIYENGCTTPSVSCVSACNSRGYGGGFGDPTGRAACLASCPITKGLQVCNNSCQLVNSTTPCSSLSICGNGRLESGENCDDGAGLNGKPGNCNSTCTARLASLCGNQHLNEPQEFCDTNLDNKCQFTASASTTLGAGPCAPYSPNKNQSCQSDCSGFGSYCGDGVTDYGYGEQCDSNESCAINGQPGTKICNVCSTDNSLALSSWRFNDLKNVPNPAAFEGLSFYSSDNLANHHAFCGATANTCPQLVDTRSGFGKAVQLDGVDDYFDLRSNSDFNGRNFSISVWIKPTGTDESGYATIVAKKNRGGFALNYRYNKDGALDGSKGFVSFELQNYDRTRWSGISNQIDSEPGTILPNVWTNLIATYDGTRFNLYVNGVKQGGGKDFDLNISTDGLIVGRRDDFSETIYSKIDQYFKGQMDDLAYYSRSLTESEIISIARSTDEWLCALNSSVAASPIALAGHCGDGVVGEDEVCDNGAHNGVPCDPDYNRSCSYCAAGCRNIIFKEPAEYCGDNIINGPEVCEAVGGVNYAKVSSAGTVAGRIGAVNGYKVKSCNEEYNLDINSNGRSLSNDYPTVASRQTGNKECINSCAQLKDDCVSCGGASESGVEVSGRIVNVIDKDSNNPLYATTTVFYPLNSTVGTNSVLELFYIDPSGSLQTGDHRRDANRAACGGGSNTYTLKDGANCDQTLIAKINPDSICSDNPVSSDRRAYYLSLNEHRSPLPTNNRPNQPIRRKLFPVTRAGSLDSGFYDLLISPRLDATTTPGHIRIVLSWQAPEIGDELVAGFITPDTKEGPSISPAAGFSAELYRAGVYNRDDEGLWYHGFEQLLSPTREESFTVDYTKMTDQTYMFYVRTLNGDGINRFRNRQVKVEVYYPDIDSLPDNVRHFSFPAQTFYLDNVAGSDNPEASYWHVFNVVKNNVSNLTLNPAADDLSGVYYVDNSGNTTINGVNFSIPNVVNKYIAVKHIVSGSGDPSNPYTVLANENNLEEINRIVTSELWLRYSYD